MALRRPGRSTAPATGSSPSARTTSRRRSTATARPRTRSSRSTSTSGEVDGPRRGRRLLRRAAPLAGRRPASRGSSGATRTCPGTGRSCGSADVPARRLASATLGPSPAARPTGSPSRAGRPTAILHFVAEPNGWMNLHRLVDGRIEPIAPGRRRVRRARTGCSASRTTPSCGDGSIVAIARSGGRDRLYRDRDRRARSASIDVPFTEMSGLARRRRRGSSCGPRRRRRRPRSSSSTRRPADWTVLRAIDDRTTSTPPTSPSRGRSSSRRPAGGPRSACSTRPRTASSTAPDGELPPLIVTSHGGPTAAAFAALTRRGPAVHEPRLRGPRRRLRRQHRLRPRLPQAARGRVGRRRSRRLRQRRSLARRPGPRRRRAARDPRRQRQRLHDALRASPSATTFQAGTSYFGIGDLETFVARDPQVRVALHSIGWSARARSASSCIATARRSTSPTRSRARC